MLVSAEMETPRPPTGEGFSDALTFAFGDPGAGVYGLARAGLAGGGSSGLAVLFHEGRTVAVRAEGGAAAAHGWEEIGAAGVTTRVRAPLESWDVFFDGGDDGGFALEAEALGAPATVAPDSPAGAAGAMQGYEHLVHLRGTVRVGGGEEIAVDCLGQRGHQWGAPDWERMALARTLGAWLAGDLAVMLTAVRPAKAGEHDAEAVTASVLEGVPVVPAPISKPLLSTTYDGDRRQRSAGFELWADGDASYPRRGAGEVICGTSLDLGRLRMDCAFFRWRMDGREGVGRYDVLRRA
jgi:hypothetical protein